MTRLLSLALSAVALLAGGSLVAAQPEDQALAGLLGSAPSAAAVSCERP